MDNRYPSPDSQSGIALLEALVAILIFSVGILALVGLQATAIKQSSDARYRSEAAALANELIGQMWLVDRTDSTQITTKLQSDFESPDGPEYKKWATRLSSLPNGVATVTIDDPGTELAGRVFITIQWRAPNDPADAKPHQYLSSTMIQ